MTIVECWARQLTKINALLYLKENSSFSFLSLLSLHGNVCRVTRPKKSPAFATQYWIASKNVSSTIGFYLHPLQVRHGCILLYTNFLQEICFVISWDKVFRHKKDLHARKLVPNFKHVHEYQIWYKIRKSLLGMKSRQRVHGRPINGGMAIVWQDVVINMWLQIMNKISKIKPQN